MSAISLENVYFKYEREGHLILNNVSMDVEYGKITLLAGYSGSGKSTIFSLICGIIPNLKSGLFKGIIKINDEESYKKSLSEITSKVGMILQSPEEQIIQELVSDEIAFGCENLNMEPSLISENVSKYAQMFKINLDDLTRSLSGGEKERLICASILAMGHKIIVLDEPLANLDLKSAHILMEKLNELKKEGYAILVVEHRTDIIKEYVDTLYYLEEGLLNRLDVSKLDEKQFSSKIMFPKSNNISAKALEITNLSYSVKKRQILNDINLIIYQGEKLLIKGDNGAGKTTLIKAITGVLKVKKKMIKSDLVKFRSKKWFKEFGVVYQNPNYQLVMKSVFEELRFYTSSDEEAFNYLKEFNLFDYKNEHPQSLSLGQKRKLTVLCALAKKPRIIILDEPTVGQDFSSLKMICEAIEAYHQSSNATIITITHDARCQDAFCDRFIEIKNGRIIN
jgi:hypothetical protein CLOSPO_03009